MKYHISLKTGQPNICRATVKPCPVGGENEHYDSKEEARAAFEKSNETFVKLEKIDKKLEVNARNLIANLSSSNNFPPKIGTKVEGFKYLGGGFENNAYLHEDSGLVFKVMNEHLLAYGWNEEESNSSIIIRDEQKKVYESINEEQLELLNAKYVDNTYITVTDNDGLKVPVLVQPYLDEEEYEPYKLSSTEFESLNSIPYLDDLNDDNVYREKSTGKIVLFDSLAVLDEDW